MYSRAFSVALLFALSLGCAASPERWATPGYDEYTGRLLSIYADQDRDGRVDQWSYFDGNRPLRGEKDVDGDGRIDRWEYFDQAARLVRVGSSSVEDGIEDTWTWPTSSDQEGRVDRSRARDRHIDRSEYFLAGVIRRAEEDTNRDGLIDRWDHFDGAALRRAEFDTTHAAGKPNRRVFYSAVGQFERVEVDPEFDGSFVAAASPPPRG